MWGFQWNWIRRYFRKDERPHVGLPEEEADGRIKYRAVEIAIVRRLINGYRVAKFSKDWETVQEKVVGTVIEGDGYGSRRKSPCVEFLYGLAQWQDVTGKVLEPLNTRSKQLGRHVEGGFPLMLVIDAQTVITENQKPLAA